MRAEDAYLRTKTKAMRKKQETVPAKSRGRKAAFADVVLSESDSNSAEERSSVEIVYPNGVRVLLPQGSRTAVELMCYVKAYGE